MMTILSNKVFKANLLTAMTALAMSGCGMEAGEPANPGAPESAPMAEGQQALSYNGHDYLFIRSARTWPQAKAICEDFGYGLVTINSAEEEAWLHGFEGPHVWWIGFNDQAVEGVWRWSQDTSSYANWNSGEPNDLGGEDCAVDNSVAGRWNDTSCTSTRYFICESLP